MVVTAAQAFPKGATEMGWKTIQGHRGDFATAPLPLSSRCGHVMYNAPVTPLVNGNEQKLLILLVTESLFNPGYAVTLFWHVLMKGKISQPWCIPHGAERTMTSSCAG